MCRIRKANQEGSTLVVTTLVLVILSILGTAALTLTNTELLIARNMKLNAKAFYLAEGAVNEAIHSIQKNGVDQDWIFPDAHLDITSSTYWNTHAQQSAFSDAKYIAELNVVESQMKCFGRGYVQDAENTVSVGLNNVLYSGYALFSNGGIELKDNTDVYGDIFANGDILTKNYTQVFGNIKATGEITTAYCNGTTSPSQDSEEIYSLDWDNIEINADNSASTKTFTGNESGLWYLTGDAFISEDTNFDNNISIVAEGKIETSKALNMHCKPGFPALASKSDIEINSGNSTDISDTTEVHGLVYALNKVEVKGELDTDIYGSIVTNATGGNALELKSGNGTLKVEHNSTSLFNLHFTRSFWNDI